MFAFEFKDGERHFEMHASKFTGQEVVKCNGKVMSDKTSYDLASPHQFECIDAKGQSDHYQVSFYTNQKIGIVGCRIKKNGTAIFQEQLSPLPLIKRALLLITAVAIIFGFVIGFLVK
jgi:hypothetical protein